MKSVILSGVVAVSAVCAEAQLFSPESIGGAALGGLAGGIIGHNSHGRTAEGVGIGAGAGLLLGSLVHNERAARPYYVAPVVAAPAPYYAVPVAPAPYYYAPAVTYYDPPRPNYALTGAALGGLAGGIIGHNQGGHTLEGLGIGAGAGWLLGGLAEQHARRQVRYYLPPAVSYNYSAPPPYPAPATAPAPAVSAPPEAPAQAGSAAPAAAPINHYPGTPTAPSAMSGANSLFGR